MKLFGVWPSGSVLLHLLLDTVTAGQGMLGP